MMNPEGGREAFEEARQAEIREVQSRIRAGIDTEPAIPSRVIYFEVRGNEVVVVDPVTGETVPDEDL